ncbi:MAG: amidohydrolase [Gammaproteobacteria bacterium]|nr:amidohydrolase [Gammaproteobacteria bacterium]
MTRSNQPLAVVTVALVASVAACSQDAGPPADTIFHGDNIVTMDPQQPTVEAVAVRGETIVAAGSMDEVMALQGSSTRVVELGDNALLPGFIDSHGHFMGAGRDQTSLGLHPPPVGDVNNIDDLVRKVRAWIDEHDIPAGEAVTGRGYDDSLLEEGRHPTREDLDRASTEHPIVLTHVSGHLTTTNSAALEVSNITADTPDPPGGHVRRIAGSMEPNGVLEETARGLLAIDRYGTPSTMEEMDELIRRSIDVYLSHGTTTIQDGGTASEQADMFREAAAREPFKADVAAFVRNRAMPNEVPDVPYTRGYENGFRVAGVKLMLDGSPQGRTAWVTIPYEEGPPGAPPDYVAYGVMDPVVYKAQADQLIEAGIPIIVHANGDAAMDLMIDGVDEAVADMDPMPDHRSVIIHAQLMRADQLDRSAELNIVPSFFAAHAFFWGDWHRISFGEDRGNNTSPMGWALERGVNFTIHNDASVVPPHMMRLVSIAVNRKTRSGHILGPHQRLTVMQALHAVTLGGAYQYFEEDTKGSITVGKQADLVILDENPLTADPENLEFIPILETFSRGRSVFAM